MLSFAISFLTLARVELSSFSYLSYSSRREHDIEMEAMQSQLRLFTSAFLEFFDHLPFHTWMRLRDPQVLHFFSSVWSCESPEFL